MVRIIGLKKCTSKEGKPFISLEIQGDIVMIQSAESGRFYASAKKCSITSTFTEEVASSLIGKEIPGRIEKVNCDPYEYTVQETGEIIMLSHTWEYLPDTVASTPLYAVRGKEAA